MSDCNKSTIDAIVKNYLLSRGYEKAAAEMEIELCRTKKENADNLGSDVSQIGCRKTANGNPIIVNQTDVLLSSSQVLSSVIEDIVILGANSGNHRIYEEEYTALRSWSMTSLDIVKSEVLLLLLPTFVHWYDFNCVRLRRMITAPVDLLFMLVLKENVVVILADS